MWSLIVPTAIVMTDNMWLLIPEERSLMHDNENQNISDQHGS